MPSTDISCEQCLQPPLQGPGTGFPDYMSLEVEDKLFSKHREVWGGSGDNVYKQGGLRSAVKGLPRFPLLDFTPNTVEAGQAERELGWTVGTEYCPEEGYVEREMCRGGEGLLEVEAMKFCD